MTEARIAARLENANLLAGVKAAAAASRARLVHWTGPIANDSNLKDSNVVVLETTRPEFAVQELQTAKKSCPNAQFIVLASEGVTPEDVRRLFRAGARDVLSAPVTQDQILSALAEAIGPEQRGDARGVVIGVVKASGGVGATTLAVNLAGYFANPPHGKKEIRPDPLKVALLDFDLQFGDAALALDIIPRKDVTEIMRTPKRFDAHFLDGVVERHRSGAHLLSAPPTIIPLDAMDPSVALSIVDVAANSYEVVVMQFPTAWADWTGALLRRADHVLLVSSATVRGVAGARRILDAAAEMGMDVASWSLVFSRLTNTIDGKDMIDQARRSLGAAVIGSLSEDAAVQAACDRGRLIWETAPTSRFARELRQICDRTAHMIANKRRSHALQQPSR
jgi:pilus assembly protein CpaE